MGQQRTNADLDFNGPGGVSLTYRGHNRVANKLRALASAARHQTDPVIEEHTGFLRRTLKATPYPVRPLLPRLLGGRRRRRYRRTGRLANSWRAQKLNDGEWQVVNTARRRGRLYAAYVIGPRQGAKGRRQAWMHRGIWWHADEVALEHNRRLTRRLTAVLLDAFDSGDGGDRV